jgi:hypothetical protein
MIRNKKHVILGVSLIFFLSSLCLVYKNSGIDIYLDKKTQKFERISGPLVVFVWDVNNHYCYYNLSSLMYLENFIASKGGRVLVLVKHDSIPYISRVRASMVRAKADYAIAMDINGEFEKRFKLKTYPVVLIFNSKKKLIYKQEGFREWNNSSIFSLEKEVNEKF